MEFKVTKNIEKMHNNVKKKKRKQLFDIFEKMFKARPHGRITNSFLIIAISRRIQSILWERYTGFTPMIIIENDIKFWQSETVSLIRQKTRKTDKKVDLYPENSSCNYMGDKHVKDFID